MVDPIPEQLKQDKQTVTPSGSRIEELIAGFIVKPLRPLEDKRGDLTELFNPAWELHTEPLVYAYFVSIRPGCIRGWEMHKLQDDRIAILHGAMRWVLFDAREASPTFQRVNVRVVSHLNRALMIIPSGVIHAVQNLDTSDAAFINFPTRPYDYENPDKYRLPLKNNIIPFDFDDPPGW